MKNYIYKLTAISPVILSPRGAKALYSVVDYEKTDELPYNMIYPFYRYDEYVGYDPANTKYYIPGSSVKGALLAGNQKIPGNALMVEDLDISYKDIGNPISPVHAENLDFLNTENKKPQNKNKPKESDKEERDYHPKFKSFFDSVVGIEALKTDATATGIIRTDCDVSALIQKAANRTQGRLSEYRIQLELLLEAVSKANYSDKGREDFTATIKHLINNIKEKLQGQSNLLFLGGYKGLLRSLEVGSAKDLLWDSGIHISSKDEKAMPLGIVKIDLEV